MFISAYFRIHCHATEDCERVQQALSNVTGVPSNEFEKSRTRGYHGNDITVYELRLRKGKHLKAFEKRMIENGILEKAARDHHERIDDNCFFHMRLGKQDAYAGEMVLAHGEDTIDIRCKIQAHPAKRKRAIEEFEKGLEKISTSRSKPET